MRLSIKDPAAENDAPARTPTDEEMKKDRRARLAAMSPREKAVYFLDYYKYPVLGVIAGILLLALIVHEIAGNKPDAFNAEFLNAAYWDSGEAAARFADAAGIDLTKENCTFSTDLLTTQDNDNFTQTDLYTMEKVMVRISAAEIDVLAADEALFMQYAEEGLFMDLREVFGGEIPEKYRDAVVTAAVVDADGNVKGNAPCGIRLEDASFFNEYNVYPMGGAVIGVPANTKRPERVRAFLEFMY